MSGDEVSEQRVLLTTRPDVQSSQDSWYMKFEGNLGLIESWNFILLVFCLHTLKLKCIIFLMSHSFLQVQCAETAISHWWVGADFHVLANLSTMVICNLSYMTLKALWK